MKRLAFLLSLLVPCLFLLTSCKSSQRDQIEADIAYFTSAECAGRLPGTGGNQAVEAYLSERFQALGLSPYEGQDAYSIPYEQLVFDSWQQTQTLTAQYADGTSKVFVSGVDFTPCPWCPGSKFPVLCS